MSELPSGGKMKITVDRTKCDGYGKCVQASPKVFKLDAKMIAEVIDAKADTDEKILLAAKSAQRKRSASKKKERGKGFFPRNKRSY
jgi:ferredoxin